MVCGIATAAVSTPPTVSVGSMTEISAKAQDAIAKTVNSYPEKWSHGICALGMIDRERGTVTGPLTGYICHAHLNHPNREDLIVVNGHKAEWHKLNPEYIKWVATGSPFSHGVLNRDNMKEIFNHASVFDMEKIGKGGCLWLGKAFRYFVEDKWKPGYWDLLRNEGLDGLQAFIGASILDGGGNPMSYSHVNLVGYCSPSDLRKVYDQLREMKKNTTSTAASGSVNHGVEQGKNWGCLKGRVVKKPDGWGGFIEKQEAGDAKEYAAQLKEIFEGDPKNVK